MKIGYLVVLSLIFLVCFKLSSSEAKKRLRIKDRKKNTNDESLEQTTTATAPIEKDSEFSDLPPHASIQDLVRSMFEPNESGGGSDPNDVLQDAGTETLSSDPNDPMKGPIIIYEEEFEEKIFEANFTRMLNPSKNSINKNYPSAPICDKSFLEYNILSLIASDQLPEKSVFPTWNQQPTLRQKILFLNHTLVSYKLPPLPDCDLELLDFNLSPQRLNFFKLIQPTSIPLTLPETTNDSNKEEKENSNAAVPSNEEMLQRKRKLVELINAGYLPPDTIIKLKRGEIDVEWIERNVSKNPTFVMSMLPDPIRDLIIAGKMPKEIEEAIFSGELNKTEMAKLLFGNDEVIKLLMPKSVVEMLQERPVPEGLKEIFMSGKNATEIKEAIANDTELLQEMMSPSMYFFYNLFKVQRNKDMNVAISVIMMVVLACVMMSLGCTMTLSQIGEHAKKPKGVIIALFSQFIIMPAAAFGLTKAFDLEVFAAMAVLICGCCPGGNLSNMLAYALSGDMNLSILMTTCSSIVGLGLMPLNIFIYSRFIVSLDSGEVVPFDKIVLNIAFTIIPVGIGILIRHYKPTWVRNVMRAGGITLAVGSTLVAVLAGVMFGDAFFVHFPVKVLACCAILPMTGYFFGYFFAWVARENPKCRRTICVETGCQNVQLCSTVLKLAFNPIVVGVLFLMPLIYMIFQVVEAVLLILLFRLRNRCMGKKELVEEDSEVKKKSDIESSEDKKSSANEMKTLLENQKEDNEDTQEKNTTTNKETWPALDGTSTADAIVESFKTAGTEHLF